MLSADSNLVRVNGDAMKDMICIAYLTGAVGQSIGMFYFGKGVIAGVDVGGINYDGNLTEHTDGSLNGLVKFKVPAGAQLITGMTAGSHGQEVVAELNLPNGFAESQIVVRIDTPAGPVAARFEKLREV